MGDNIGNQQPISVSKKGKYNEIQFANGDQLDSHPNVYVTTDGTINATSFTGDGGNISNLYSGTQNRLTFYDTSTSIASADGLTYNSGDESLVINGDLTVNGNVYSVDSLIINDSIILLSNNGTDLVDSGIMLQRPSGNVFYGYKGDTSNFALGFTDDPESVVNITIDTSKNLPLDIYGNVNIQTLGSNVSLVTNGNVGIGTTSPSRNLEIFDETDSIVKVVSNTATTYVQIQADLTADTYGSAPNIKSKNESQVVHSYTWNSSPIQTGAWYSGIAKDEYIEGATDVVKYRIGTGNTLGSSKLVIDRDGNVGIGTTNPTANLHVNGTVTFESLPINGIVPSNVLHYDVATGEVTHGYMELITTKVKAGEALTKGESVYVSGSSGDFPVVNLADSSDNTKMPSIGLVLEDNLAFNDEGHVITFGEYPAGAFTTFVEGDTLYVSNVTPGGLMNTAPCSSVGPDLIQNVGVFIQDTGGSGDKILVTGVGRANDIPNSNVLSDESTVNYVYVSTSDKDLKRIDPSLLTTNIHTLQQVTDASNVTTNVVQFSNPTTAFVITETNSAVHFDSNVIITSDGTQVAIGNQAGTGQQLQAVAIGNSAGYTGQQNSAVAIGNSAGRNSQQIQTVAIGNSAGRIDQQNYAVAVGANAGRTSQQNYSVAIGNQAGYTDQNAYSVAVGNQAGYTGQQSQAVAIGNEAGYTDQNADAIAIGNSAGYTDQQDSAVAIGNNAGRNSQQIQTVAIGNSAGRIDQQNYAVAIGNQAGRTSQQNYSVAIGNQAGYTDQNAYSVAVGNQAGYTGQQSQAVAIGNEAGYTDQNAYAVAVGTGAGNTGQNAYSIAIGYRAGFTGQQNYAVAVGTSAGRTDQQTQAVAIGTSAGYTGQNAYTVAIGTGAGFTGQNAYSIAIGNSAGRTSQQNSVVAIGNSAGYTDQQDSAVAIGKSAGQSNQNAYSIAVGTNAGYTSQQNYAVAVGTNAGYDGQQTQAVAIGTSAGYDGQQNYAVAIGNNAGRTGQQNYAVAVGTNAGNSNQNAYSIAVGTNAGYTSQQNYAVAIGNSAGRTSQQTQAVAVGTSAGRTDQQDSAVAIGNNAGYTGQNAYSIAVGFDAGRTGQQTQAVAIGYEAGRSEQQNYAVAIGNQAGSNNQNTNAIAIGNQAGQTGQGTNSVAVGYLAGFNNQHDRTIVLNANATVLNTVRTEAFYVKPINQAQNTSNVLTYDASSGEITESTGVVWDATNSQLGIDQTSPTHTLHIGTNTLVANTTTTQVSIGKNTLDTGIALGVYGRIGVRDGYNIGSYDFQTGIFPNLSNLYLQANGTTAMTVFNDGKVGIGTATPSTKLHIVDSVNLATINIRSSAAAADGVGGKIIFGHTDDGIAQIEGKYNGGTLGANKDLFFYSGGDLGTAKMILNGSGNVGIGTTAPSSLLEIKGASAKQIIHTTSGNPELEFNDSGTDEFSIYYDTDNKSLNFNEGGIGTHLAIKDGGNVGIGTSSPLGKMDIRQTESGNTAVMYGGSGGKDILTITRNSTVGVPTSSFLGSVGINVDSSNPQITFTESSLNHFSMGVMSSDETFRIASNQNIGTDDRFTIKQSGEVGIGTVAPREKLTVLDNLSDGGFVCNFKPTGPSGNGLYIARYDCGTDNDRTGLYFQNENVFNTRLWIDDNNIARLGSSNPVAHNSGVVIGTQTSDRRLKNINGNLELGLNEILKLNPVSYSLKKDKEQTERLGFIAQEVKEVIPQSVYDTKEPVEEGEDTLFAMDYTTIIPVLVNAVKDLQKEIEELKSHS